MKATPMLVKPPSGGNLNDTNAATTPAFIVLPTPVRGAFVLSCPLPLHLESRSGQLENQGLQFEPDLMNGLKGLMDGIFAAGCTQNTHLCFFRAVFFLVLTTSGLSIRQSGAVTLQWDPNSETDIAGYKIYYGETNTPPITMLDVGNATSVVITNLAAGKTYFFYATAYNTAALESSPSEQIFYTAPPAGITNVPPSIANIPDQTITEDSALPSIELAINDLETAAVNLTVQPSSSNTNLVPNANLFLNGSGANRSLLIRPATNQFGTTTITITVSDGLLSTQTSFALTVTPVNDLPVISKIGDRITSSGASLGPLSFIVEDVETGSGALVVSAASSNPVLIPDSSILLGGSGTNRTVSLSTAPGQFGSATITLSVSDGQATNSSSFVITVNTLPPEPSNMSIGATASGAITLLIQSTVGQAYTIEASTDLKNWSVIGTASNSGGGTATFLDQPSGNRFYRAATQ